MSMTTCFGAHGATKETCQGQCRDKSKASKHVGLAVKLTEEEAGKLRKRLASGEQVTVRGRGQ